MHTTQFAIRKHGWYAPVLELAMRTVDERPRAASVVRIAGVMGRTRQATAEARVARDLGYEAGLLSLGALKQASDDELIAHVRAVGAIIPLFGFYLQPAVGGRVLSERFWRRFAEVESVVAIKIAPFDRYRTLEVMRAVDASGRGGDIALYTGNDDHIVLDLLMPKMVGGLLGHWAVWTRRAVQQHRRCRSVAGKPIPASLLRLAGQVTEANAAIFDAAHGFAGCIPGIHEVLRRQGLLAGRWCLDPREELSRGQAALITEVLRKYPGLTDDDFVAERLDGWLSP